MKIISARKASLPLLLVPVIFAPVTAVSAEEQTMIVSATPQTVSELDTPAAVSVVNGDDMAVFIQQFEHGGNGRQP